MSAKFYPKATDSLAWNKPNTARPSGATTQKLLGTLDIHSLDCLKRIFIRLIKNFHELMIWKSMANKTRIMKGNSK